MDVVSDKKIARVVASQGKTRVYEMDDGAWVTAKEGTVSWRNNNPGNLKFEFAGSADHTVKSRRSREVALHSAQTQYDGVVDLDQWGNAIFESADAGREAQKKLLLDKHDQHTVEQLVRGYSVADYSGATHHDSQVKTIYATALAQGHDLHGKTVGKMSDAEQDALADGIARAEYWKAGTVTQTAALSEDELRAVLAAEPQPSQHRTAPTVHKQGDRGADVGALQSDLANLGYKANDGTAIHADQHFGPRTKEALEAFQSSHGLKADGVAGPATLAAIAEAKERVAAVPSLTDPRHPANGIYEQAFQCVARIDAEQGRSPGPHTQNFAGGLTVAATAAGFDRVDHVVLSDDASRSWAVQGELNSPFKQYTEVSVMSAIQTPLQQSSQEAAINVQNNAQQHAMAQQQTQQQVHEPSLHAGPVMSR
ncbi:peptidoglycan hydrolase-like protein with peptidoglycan-binding domain [Luteibacter sp. 621]|uniref:XVIPCD domain-containing protein n=1 Tax=Luteibacter sp. 621 TaxID=3373916 RepID=UPI003D19CE4E